MLRLSLVFLAGCVSLDGLSGGAGEDAPNAIVSSGRCDGSKPFEVKELVHDGDVFGARRDPAETTFFFTRSSGDGTATLMSGPDLASATGDAFTELVSLGSISYPSITPSGLAVYFTVQSPMVNGLVGGRIYSARRATTNDGFSLPRPMAVVAAGPEFTPYVPASGHALYFMRHDPSPVSMPGHHVMRLPLDTDGDAEEVLDITDFVGSPVVTGDERTLFFAWKRGASIDVFVATRASTKEPFTNAKLVTEVSGDGSDEAPTWVSSDGCVLLYETRAAAGMPRTVRQAVRSR